MNTKDKTGKRRPRSVPGVEKKAGKKGRTYKEAGVDIDAGAEFVRRITPLVKKTFNSRVVTDIGGFSGLYNFDPAFYEHPVLVSSTDGVGTKLKVAFMADIHDTVGIDLVAMCVNDILAQGARPLFFLDYLAVSKLIPDQAVEIMKGIVKACQEVPCALIGRETAELPDFYLSGEYDLAGFVVGVVERDKIIDNSEVRVGDKIIGLGSNGLHSNGYTLVRRIIFDDLKMKVTDRLLDTTVSEELLRPTRIYVNTVHMLLRDFKITGIAHITGGGILENISRVLPQTCQAVLKKDSWKRPPIFDFIQKEGGVAEGEMFRTFNMGVGLVIIVPSVQSAEVLERLNGMDEPVYLIGEIKERSAGKPPVVLV
ncbi:MAG: phosphoribosylformylglycinamidine cyclo-ligase [Deltaproteobacteria bacterium]|nr:phosphoribosylformylglycinamidine cyclo-ligase [Deltaproteobacteria bacterium]